MRATHRKRPRFFLSRRVLTALIAVQMACFLIWALTWPPRQLSFLVAEKEAVHWNQLIDNFHHKNRALAVRYETTDLSPNDGRASLYKTDFKRNKDDAIYDLVLTDSVWTAPFAEDLLDLTAFAKKDRLDASLFVKGEWDAGTIDGKLYRIPMYTDVGVLYYRKDLLAAVGLDLDSTLADLPGALTRLQENSPEISLGPLWQGREYEGLIANFAEVLNVFGGTWLSENDKKVTLDNPKTIAAAESLQVLIQGGFSSAAVTGYDETESLRKFKEGRTVFLRGWPSFWAELSKTDWAENIGITRPFAFTGYQQGGEGEGVATQGYGCRGGWGFGIPANSAHAEESWQAIKYFTSVEGQEQFVQDSGLLPSRQELWKDKVLLKKYHLMQEIAAGGYLESAVVRPPIPNYFEASNYLQDVLSEIIGGQPAAPAMKQAQKDSNS